jgi:hypothetical protein
MEIFSPVKVRRIDRGVGVGGRRGVLKDAGDQGDDHGDDRGADDDDEDGFDETIVFALQETNHERVTTFGMGAFLAGCETGRPWRKANFSYRNSCFSAIIDEVKQGRGTRDQGREHPFRIEGPGERVEF